MPGANLDGDLCRLRDELVLLGGLVEKVFVGALDAIARHDAARLEQVRIDHQRIGRKRLAIEVECLNLVASQSAPPDEIRTVVAMLEMAYDLARMGDYAHHIARAHCVRLRGALLEDLTGMHRMATVTLDMIHCALRAFVSGDVGPAQKAATELRTLDTLFSQVRHELLSVMQGRPDVVREATCLLRMAYDLRRAAARVASMCEWVAFALTGTVADFQVDLVRPALSTACVQPSSMAL